VPHLLWHGTSVFRSHPKDRPIQSPFTTHEEVWRIYSNLDPHGDSGPLKGEDFIVLHLLWHGASVFAVSSEGIAS
jgi:hypothetical protein